jgi:hypothetical protein
LKQLKGLNSMKTIQDIEIGFSFEHKEKGIGVICDKTTRSLTAIFEKSKCKVTYKHKDAYFFPSDF